MSQTLADIRQSGGEFIVGAFVGENGDASIQFTGNGYIQLNAKQVRKLIKILQNRINRKKGFQATDSEDYNWDGSI